MLTVKCECGQFHYAPLGFARTISRCKCGASIPIGQVPTWVRLVKRLRVDIDKGVGDTVARIAVKFGGERFKQFSKRIGIPCGCTERQAAWNKLYPY